MSKESKANYHYKLRAPHRTGASFPLANWRQCGAHPCRRLRHTSAASPAGAASALASLTNIDRCPTLAGHTLLTRSNPEYNPWSIAFDSYLCSKCLLYGVFLFGALNYIFLPFLWIQFPIYQANKTHVRLRMPLVPVAA